MNYEMLCYQLRSQKYLGYYIFLIQQSKMSYYVGINVGMRCKLQPLKLQDVLTMTVICGGIAMHFNEPGLNALRKTIQSISVIITREWRSQAFSFYSGHFSKSKRVW